MWLMSSLPPSLQQRGRRQGFGAAGRRSRNGAAGLARGRSYAVGAMRRRSAQHGGAGSKPARKQWSSGQRGVMACPSVPLPRRCTPAPRGPCPPDSKMKPGPASPPTHRSCTQNLKSRPSSRFCGPSSSCGTSSPQSVQPCAAPGGEGSRSLSSAQRARRAGARARRLSPAAADSEMHSSKEAKEASVCKLLLAQAPRALPGASWQRSAAAQ